MPDYTDVYPNVAPTIAPQAGKVYRTRNGTKVGPLVPETRNEGYAWHDPADGIEYYVNTWTADGRFHADRGTLTEYDIIAEWADAEPEAPPSPVRRRTVTEINPGQYGVLEVGGVYIGTVNVKVWGTYGAAELRAAASTLTALADALDEIGAQK